MNIFQVFQPLSPADYQPQHLVLRHGQIINATLLDMFANGDAKISFHGQVIRAKLETPLAVGQHTFMQVKSFQDGTVNMRIITNNEQKATNVIVPTTNINDLLKSVNLPQNSAWRELTQQLISKNIPLLPEIMKNGLEVLGKEPTRDQQQTWLSMLERGLPINKATFQSVHQMMTGQPIDKLIQNFQQLANQFLSEKIAALPNTQQMQTGITQQPIGTQNIQPIQPTQSIIEMSQLNARVPEVNVNVAKENAVAQQTLNAQPVRANNGTTAQTNVQTAMSQINMNSIQPAASQVTTNSLAIAQSEEVTKPNTTQHSQNQELIRNVIRLNQLFEGLLNQTTQASTSTKPVTSTDNHIIATILKLVGYQHEKTVQALFQNFQQSTQKQLDYPATMQQTENIKQLLLQLIDNKSYPIAMREMATQLVNNVNGQQLLSSPQDNHNLLQNTMLQIPIAWSEHQQDTLKLQIQGRKDRKTIDPNNCSIYIELDPPNLGELGIFIHIVNKVVSIRLLSENEQMKHLTHLTEGLLKEGLAEQDYLLSYIKVEALEEARNNKKNPVNYKKTPQTGFDMRI